MIFERIISKFFGYTIVALLDYDGEVHKCWAKETPFGFAARRALSHLLLKDDGTVKGNSYTTHWKLWYPSTEPLPDEKGTGEH